jgi:radical SAM superfamily enzyme YgiQ (UPF0313 family)
MECAFEQGPIRPPSESQSLLIRAVRNCPWNKCAFCHTYRGTRFSLRRVAEIKEDIRRVAGLVREIKALSGESGDGGAVTAPLVRFIYSRPDRFDLGWRTVAAWLYWGASSVFLQDANAIIMKTDELVEVLTFLRETLPGVTRITSYCRSRTAARTSPQDWQRLREAGLSRVHTGLESGSDTVLAFMKKGVTAADQIAGGRRVVEAGISLCEYVMPGLGGRQWSREHAVETARVVNRIDPAFVRLRSLHVVPGTDLHDEMAAGRFAPLDDEETLREIRLFVESLEDVSTTLVSDHVLNLIEELQGKLPEDKERLLATIDRYFALPEEDRYVYRVGRRMGVYHRLDDLNDTGVYRKVQGVLADYRQREPGALEKDLEEAMHGRI